MKRSVVGAFVRALAVFCGVSAYGDEPVLPDGYERVSYLQATGQQWINTKYVPKWTDRFEAKVRFSSSSQQAVYCSRGTKTNDDSFTLFWISGGTLRFDYDTQQKAASGFTPTISQDYTIVANGAEGVCTVATGEGDAKAVTTLDRGEFTVGGYLTFFASHVLGTDLPSGTTVNMTNLGDSRIYWFRIYDADGNLVKNYVPVYNNNAESLADRAGFYETVDGEFLGNSGLSYFQTDRADAGEVLFLGTTDNDLTKPENWSTGELPGATDTIKLTPGNGVQYLLPTALSVKGIVVEPGGSFSLTGEGQLTIGSAGVAFASGSSSWLFTLDVPVAFSAVQVWTLSKMKLETKKPFEGTATVQFGGISTLTHTVAPDYGGRLEYAGKTYDNCEVSYKTRDRWAADVLVSDCHLVFKYAGEYVWKDIFPSGSFEQAGWGSSGVRFANAAGADVTFEAGDRVKTGGDSSSFGAGNFTAAGGYMNLGGLVSVIQGSTLSILGGCGIYCGYGFLVGGGLSGGDLGAVVEQSGGAVTNICFLQIGGRGGKANSMAEYRLSGGRLVISTLSDSSVDRGINVPSSRSSGADPCVGVFTQTGGETMTRAVQFGSAQSDWDSKVNVMTNGFGLFDLRGGTLNLGNAGFRLGASWNVWVVDSATQPCPWGDSRYRIRLSGGTLVPYSDYSQTLQWDVPHGDGFTFDGSKWTFAQSAPIWGEGTFRKTGEKDATFVDLTRFTGTLDLMGGRTMIAGATVSTGTVDGDCVIFRADDAAAGLEEGAAVSSWSDAANTLSVTTLSGVLAAATNCCLSPKVSKTGFNGHAALDFWHSGAQVAALGAATAQNPLLGSTNYTMAVVFKTTASGSCALDQDYQYYYASGLLGCSTSYGQNSCGISVSSGSNVSIAGGRAFQQQASGSAAGWFGMANSKPKYVNDGKVHVFVTGSEGHLLRSSLDGWCSERLREGIRSDVIYPIGKGLNGQGTNVAPLMIGVGNNQVWSYENKAAPTHAFVGQIAEIRIYPNRCLNAAEMNALAFELGRKYNSEAPTDEAFCRNANRSVLGAWNETTAAKTDLPAGAYEWTGESAVGADGSEVTAWTAAAGGLTATQTAGGGEKGPTVVRGALSGRDVLRFDGAAKTALGIPKDVSPVTGTRGHACAVVFRTTTDGVDENAYRGGRGLVSTIQNATAVEDWAIALQKEGSIDTGYGSASGGAHCFVRKPCRLADGAVHVAILSADQTNQRLWQMIDGRATGVALTTTKARTAYDVLIGSLCTAKDKYFTGDIAAVAIWDHALTVEEMTAVTEHYAERYSFYPLAKSKFAAADLTERGVAAKEIKVGTGATLLLPMSAARPFTLKAGQSLTGEGTVFGSVRWGAGTVLDTGSAARPEDLQLQDATIRFAAGTVPYDGSHITSVSGAITLDVTAVVPTPLPSRLLLITLPKGVVADGTVFRLVGADSFSRAFYDESRGGLILRTSRGLQLLVR